MMQVRILKRIGIVAGIILIAVLARPIFNVIANYYLKSPSIVITIFVGIIVMVYLIVFFKEIFLKRKE
jgi:CBS domain containing-hemolysin-like protein